VLRDESCAEAVDRLLASSPFLRPEALVAAISANMHTGLRVGAKVGVLEMDDGSHKDLVP